MTQDNFTDCVKRNQQRLFLIALSFTRNHSDAEDILQTVFFRLCSHKKPFQDEAHLDRWLTVVCINESKNYLRAPFRTRTVPFEDTQMQYTFQEERSYDLFAAVMALPTKERIVIHLFYYEDLPVKEIASLLKINVSAVKTRLHRARNHLKELLGDEWIYES